MANYKDPFLLAVDGFNTELLRKLGYQSNMDIKPASLQEVMEFVNEALEMAKRQRNEEDGIDEDIIDFLHNIRASIPNWYEDNEQIIEALAAVQYIMMCFVRWYI